MLKPDSMMIAILLIAVYLHGLTRESSGEMTVVLTPANAVVSDRENVTLQCILNDVDTRSYTIKWSHTPYSSGPLQSNTTLVEDTLSRTLKSSLTLSRPGPDFITVLYFCEVLYTGRGGNLVTFAQSVISRSTVERKSECFKSGGQEKVIHLFQQGPSVNISCQVLRNPDPPTVRWNTLQRDRDDKIQLDFDFGDDGTTYRYINSSLEWNQLLDGVILYCKATTTGTTIVAEPCVIGLIKVVQEPKIIPRHTSLSFGLVNEAEFWCDTIGLNHQSCSYIWECQPMVSGCHGNNDTIIIVVDESSVPENEIDVNCQVECIPGVSKEAHATLTINSPLSESDTPQRAMPSTEHADTKVSLQLHSNSKDDYVLKCTANFTGNDEPTFTWYIDGKREISNICEVMPMQSTFHVDHSFNLVVCDVLLNDDITRVWSTFTEFFDTTPDNDATNDPVVKSTKPVLSDLSASSLLLIVLISICGSMALVVFAWIIAVSTLKRNLYRNPIEASKVKRFRAASKVKTFRAASKVKTFRAKPRCPSDGSGINMTPNAEQRKGDFVDSLGDYAYPSVQMKNLNYVNNGRDEYFDFQDVTCDKIELNESNYEEFPGDNPCSQGEQSLGFVNQPLNSWTLLSSTSSSSPCSSSDRPPTPPLTHEYHTTCDVTTTSRSDSITDHRFIQHDSLSSPHSSHQLFHEYLA